MKQRSIAVIGGGITGVTTAYALVNRGYAVTLFEKHRYVAMETSYANGGQLSASNAEVWNHPSTILKGLKWMLTSNAPLLVNPRPTWHKLSWFAEFVAHLRNYEANTVATARLAIAAREPFFRWADELGIAFDARRQGILHVYRRRETFEHAGKVSALLAKAGLARRSVTPDEMKAIEPSLKGNFYGGYYTESDATGDIHLYTTALARSAQDNGARILCGVTVKRVESDSRGIGIVTDQGERHSADAVVVCAGVGSRALARQLGDRINIYPVKGYSITVNLQDDRSRSSAPTVSLLDDETKLVSSRLGADRLRVAGTAEFNGIDYDIRSDRIEPLVHWVNSCFPDVDTHSVVPWAGLRPMTPNMLPRVGRGKRERVFFNTGHGHLGWTLSAATAEIVARSVMAVLPAAST